MLVRCGSGVVCALATACATVAQTPLGSAFTYQGQLEANGGPVSGPADFRFSLWDSPGAGSPPVGGTQIGSTQTMTAVSVSRGRFAAPLNATGQFGAAFAGDARWLQVAVRVPAGSGSYTTLGPRQALTAAPYALTALGLRSGALVAGATGAHVLRLEHTASSGFAYGVYGQSASGDGIGVAGRTTANVGGMGVYGRSDGVGGYGVYGAAANSSGESYGIFGYSASSAGYAGFFTGVGADAVRVQNGGGGRGIQAYALNDTAIWGRTDNGLAGVDGWNGRATGRGVSGYASATTGINHGVWGQSASTSGTGVLGWASAANGAGTGVYGESAGPLGTGVHGVTTAASGAGTGVFGASASASGGRGVYGYASASSGTNYGVYGYSNSPSGFAGYFNGRVSVTGNLSKGGGSFKIDHPLDPANQYLYHSFVESPDMKNIYDGVVTLDADGAAVVSLPDWFEALNGGFRYQLTPLGGWAPLYIAQEVRDNRFAIAGGAPGMKVSWQVTGIRRDAYANAHRIPVEEPKPLEERGLYLHPTEAGHPPEFGLDAHRRTAHLPEDNP